jgi:DNA-binding CsgD family transcriptional regulator
MAVFPGAHNCLASRKRHVFSMPLGGDGVLRDATLMTVDRTGRLKLVQAGDDEAFEQRWAACVVHGKPKAAALFRLGASGPGSGYLARLVPLREARPRVLLMLHQLAAANIAPVAIQAGFDLSIAEARLAGALIRGQSVTEYAAENGLSRNTARNQLSAIFMKTGTRRQAELVALVIAALGPGWGQSK